MAEMTIEKRADLFLGAMAEDDSREFLRGMFMEHMEQAVEAQVRELREALQPFAKYADKLVGAAKYQDCCPLRAAPELPPETPPTVGDCRKARQILSQTGADR